MLSLSLLLHWYPFWVIGSWLSSLLPKWAHLELTLVTLTVYHVWRYIWCISPANKSLVLAPPLLVPKLPIPFSYNVINILGAFLGNGELARLPMAQKNAGGINPYVLTLGTQDGPKTPKKGNPNYWWYSIHIGAIFVKLWVLRQHSPAMYFGSYLPIGTLPAPLDIIKVQLC